MTSRNAVQLTHEEWIEARDALLRRRPDPMNVDIPKSAEARLAFWDRFFDVSNLPNDLKRKLSLHDLRRLGYHALKAMRDGK